MKRLLKRTVLFVMIATALAFTACGGGSSSTPVDTTPDTTAPTVASTSPAADDVDVALDAFVEVTFSEALDGSTVDDATLTLLADGAADPVMATLSYMDGMFKFQSDPNYQLATDTLYHATLTATVADVAGNMLADELAWSFTTSATDLVPPGIAEVFPADGSVANTLTQVIATYSESTIADPADGVFTLTCEGVDVTGSTGYDPGEATFIPGAPLTVGDSCTAAFSGTVEDAAANSAMASATWSFTVAYPMMTGTPMAAGPVGAGTSGDITVPLNAAADCANVTLTDGTGGTFGSGSGCKASPGDTEATVSVLTVADPGGDYYIEVLAYNSTGGVASDYVYDDTISMDNYAWSTADIGVLEDSTIPLGLATLEPMPDMTIEVLATEDFGAVTRIWYEACNDGFADADPFEVSVFIDPAATPAPVAGDPADGYGGIYGLAAGWCEVDSIFAQGRFDIHVHGTYIYAIADSAQDVDESNETNNIGSNVYVEDLYFDFEASFHPELTGTWYRDTSQSSAGLASARSLDISNNQTTSMQYITLPGYSTVSFEYKVSSEKYFDILYFYIDGIAQNNVQDFSGAVPWTSAEYSLDPGTAHTLRWEYRKDSSVTVGSDTAWVDEIIIAK